MGPATRLSHIIQPPFSLQRAREVQIEDFSWNTEKVSLREGEPAGIVSVWSADVTAEGAPAAILEHEVTLRMKVIH